MEPEDPYVVLPVEVRMLPDVPRAPAGAVPMNTMPLDVDALSPDSK